MEKYWLTLFPDTFLWIKTNYGMIYNSKKMIGFQFKLNKEKEKLCRELLLAENLYSVSITQKDFANVEMQELIKLITSHEAGNLVSGIEKRPVSFKPILKILNDYPFYVWENNEGFGSSIMKNMHELTFYINQSCAGSNSYFRQTIFPLKECSHLPMENIIAFVRHSQNPFLSNINFVGNIFLYPDFKHLIENTAILAKTCTIYITIQDFNNHIEEFKSTQWPDNIRFSILINSIPVDSYVSLEDLKVEVTVIALIFSEKELNLYYEQFKNIPIYYEAKIIPIFDGENINFFKENVFISQEDINESKVTKRNIFINQVLNINDFGKLNILPDGTVFANLNMNPLGNITRDTSYSLIYKEFTEGKSFFRIRNQEPCSDCLYQWLCPSPSNYELILGRQNLCHIENLIPCN